jgi:uncharacterized protein with ParB-like and HNH nuclease domain
MTEIVPGKQNIEIVFSSITYHIDFYQRDYKWTKENVASLLEDIFHKFQQYYKPSIDASDETISDHYGWYYMNTFVTNRVGGKVFVVDGQQRLTTLTLILINLYHLAGKYELPSKAKWIEKCILGHTSSGVEFWIGQDERKEAFENLYNNNSEKLGAVNQDGLGIKNIYNNYLYIQKYLEKALETSHKFETFALFLMKRVVMVNLDVGQTDVPMVFEVINDRGEKLKPYEILKGKLLGQIDKGEVKKYLPFWDDPIHKIQALEKDDSGVDYFLSNYFKAKFTDTRAENAEFDKEYHKTIFDAKWNEKIQLKLNPEKVKEFLKNNFRYYIKLYIKIIEEIKREEKAPSPYLYFNSLNEQERQVLLIFSACEVDDPAEDEKILLISKLLDRHFTLLNLNGCYDSNEFTEELIKINTKIRNQPSEIIKSVFDEQLISYICQKRGTVVSSPFIFSYFNEAGYHLPIRFLRYFFARIEHFISQGINVSCESYRNLVKNTGTVNGYHIEHILANNDENLSLFDNEEEDFEKERNKLGGLLLLKGRDNQSSGKEVYKDKLKTYVGTNLWNQTLLSDFYKSNKDMEAFSKKYSLSFKPFSTLDIDFSENRNELLFEIIKIIWGDGEELII